MTDSHYLDNLIRYIANPNPTAAEAQQVFTPLTTGEYDDVHIAALLTALKVRGEQPADVIGAARAFIRAARPFPQVQALDMRGVGWALGAATMWATYILFGKRVGHLHAGHSVSLGLLAAALVAVPVGVAHAGLAALLRPDVLLMALVVALVSSAIPISLEMYALKRLPRHTFGIMLSLEPAVAALAGMVLLQESLLVRQWLAIGCIMAASVGSILSRNRR